MHRYSEFHELAGDIRSAFAGTHTLSMIPSLPGRRISWLTNQLAPDFIEKRRVGLEVGSAALVHGVRRALCPSARR